MRRLAALLWLLLAAAPTAAVPPGDKPTDVDRAVEDASRAADEMVRAADNATRAAEEAMRAADPARRSTDRLRIVGTCVSDHPPGGPDPLADRAFVDCECAADRVPAGRESDRAAIEQAFADCRSARAAASGLADKPPATGEAAAARPDEVPGAAAEADKPAEGAGLFAWIGGVPRWAWVAIPALLVLAFMMLRRRDRRGDLVAPPRALRPDEVAAPPRMDIPDDPAAR